MEAAALAQKHTQVEIHSENIKISWEDFERDYLSREDEFTYEWVNGTIEKTPNSMNKAQLFILDNLLELFGKLKSQGLVKGRLIAEADLFFDGNHRRPDVCWLTRTQMENLVKPTAFDVPEFIIEVVSTNDVMNKVGEKMNDYRAASVRVVWQIFPQLGEIHVYKGKNLDDMKIHRDKKTVSAAPALPNFKAKVSEILKLEK